MSDDSLDCDLFIAQHGRGAPLLTLHGGMGLDHQYLRAGLDPLGDERTLIYFDQLANGRSPGDALLRDGLEPWVQSTEALRQRLGHKRMVLFAHSFGAFIALEYAARYGHALDGLILCSAAPVFDYAEAALAKARARASETQFAALLRLLGAPAGDDETLRQGWHKVLPLYFDRPSEHADTIDSVARTTHFRARAFDYGTSVLPGIDARPHLAKISNPTLVISGATDWVMPPSHGADRLHAGLRNSERVIIEGAGHFPFLEQPESFQAIVRRWLRAL